MANPDYIERLQTAIFHLHKVSAKHVETVPVKETFGEETIWEGNVEVFSVTGHARAKTCFAWSKNAGQSDEKFTAVLGLPPVGTALDAVRVSILIAYKRNE